MKKKYLSTFLILALFSSQSYFGGNNVLANNKENKADENNKNILAENKADKDKNSSEEITWEMDDFFTTNNGKTLGGRVDIQTPQGTNNTPMSGFTAKGKEKLKKNHHVVIPEGIEIIDEVAFVRTKQTPDDEYIESVTFPSTLKKIGYGAFHSQKIKGTLEIPEGVTEISPGAFISNQIEKVILPSTLVNNNLYAISNRAFQDNKIREVVLKGNFKNVKFQIDGNDPKYGSAGPFDNQNFGEITASVGSEFKMPFVINQIGESDIQSMGGFMVNGTPTRIENCDFLTKKDGKYIITKAGKYPAQFLFYDSHGMINHPQFGRTRPFASIYFTYNIVQNNTVTFMDDDKVIKKVEVENGKNIDSDNITEEKGQMPKNPAKQGYTFKGWNTKKDGTGEDFTKTTKVTEDIIVYAIYDENTYKVNYDFKSEDGKNLPVEVANLIPKDEKTYKKGEKITPKTPTQKEISVDGGKWTFLGYDTKEQTVEDKDLTFTGTWKFTSIKPLSTLNDTPQLEVADKEIMVGEALDLRTLIIKATDKEEGDLKGKVEIVDKGGFNNNKVGTYKITYKVADSKGATVTKQGAVKVKQPQITLNEAPNLQVKDAEITVGETLNLKDLIISATDKEDGDLKDKVEINKGEFNNNKVGTYKITYKVADSIGATTVKQATVKVKQPQIELNEAPQLEVADKEIMVGEALDLRTLIISAKDKEDGDLKDKVQIVDKGGFDNSKARTYKITYKVADSIGATTAKQATVKVKQPQMTLNEAPQLEVADKEIMVGETLDLRTLIIKATDKEDGDLKDKVEINKGEFNNNKVGTYKITYKVTDSIGAKTAKQATVKVKQPQMTLNEAPNLQVKDAEITVGETLNLKDLIISATDKEDGDLKNKVEINKGEFNNNKVGTYKITYKVADTKGAATTKQATVKVKQPQMTLNEAPNLQVKDAEITVGETLNLKDLIISATDKEDGDLKDKVQIVDKGGFDNSKARTYKITYKVTDSIGATTAKQATVKVKQPQMTLNEAPNLQVKDAEITVGETLNLKDLIISAKDKEDGDLKDKVEINKGEFNNNKVGTYKITYKVTDSIGATTAKQATVKVKQPQMTLNEAPNLQVKDAEITVGETLNLKDLIISATDKEDGDLKDKVEINKGEFNNNKVGTYKITYKVTDSKGAVATKQATVKVKDKVKPAPKKPKPKPQAPKPKQEKGVINDQKTLPKTSPQTPKSNKTLGTILAVGLAALAGLTRRKRK